MERFLAIHSIPPGTNEAGFRRSLQGLAEAAERVGVGVEETVFSLERGQAYSLFEADDEASVREVVGAAGLPTPEVFRASLVYTDLLREPRRAR